MADKEARLILKIKETGSEALDKVSSGLKQVSKLAIAGFGALSGLAALGIKEYAEQEQAVNKLNQALVNQGIYSADLSKSYQDLASELQRKSLFADNDIIQSQATLQAYLGEQKVTKELLTATLDLAQAKGLNLVQAAEMMGKSIGTSTNALSRQGIELDSNLTKQEKQSAILRQIQGDFNGYALGATKGYGSLIVLKNAGLDLVEVIGEKLQPFIVSITTKLIKFSTDLQSNKTFLDAVTWSIKGIAAIGIVATSVFQTFGQTIGAVLGTYFASLGQAASGNLLQAFETIKSGMTSMKDNAVLNWTDMYTQLGALTTEFNKNQDQTQRTAVATTNETEAVGRKKRFEEKTVFDKAMNVLDQTVNSEKVKNAETGLNALSRLQSSKNKELAAIGKAAAIAQIGIDTARGAMAAYASLVGIPFIGPVLGPIAAGAVIAYGAEQVANVAGIQLAEGGIVKASAGGTLATIGEGGRDEAVIPLDKAGGMGTNITIIVNGGLMGDRASAREFAVSLDRELFELRQANQSLAFESGVV